MKEKMKIAMPSDNGSMISQHFGRAKGFIVFTIENGIIQKEEYVDNRVTGHAQGLHVDHGHHAGDEHHHSHQGILKALEGCSVVIAGGMGRRLVDDFTNNKIEIFITKEVESKKAIELFLNKSLDHNDELCCEH